MKINHPLFGRSLPLSLLLTPPTRDPTTAYFSYLFVLPHPLLKVWPVLF